MHNARSLSCTGLYEVTTKIAPQAFVDLGGTLHMIHARCSNVVSFLRLIQHICLPRVSSADWPYYSDVHHERIAGHFLFVRMHSHMATQIISSVHEWANQGS